MTCNSNKNYSFLRRVAGFDGCYYRTACEDSDTKCIEVGLVNLRGCVSLNVMTQVLVIINVSV